MQHFRSEYRRNQCDVAAEVLTMEQDNGQTESKSKILTTIDNRISWRSALTNNNQKSIFIETHPETESEVRTMHAAVQRQAYKSNNLPCVTRNYLSIGTHFTIKAFSGGQRFL